MFGIFKRKPKTEALPSPEGQKEIAAEPLPQAHERVVHVGFIVGHSKKDQGAVMGGRSGMTEYEYNRQLSQKLINMASQSFPKLKVSVFYRDNLGISAVYARAKEMLCDAVIELHFNASEGKKATGTETLCTPDTDDVEFSHIIHKQICDVFNRVGDSRGVVVVGRSTRGAANVYAFDKGVNCLIEPFFGDSEAELGIQKMEPLAVSLLNGVMTWAHKKGLLKAAGSPSTHLP